MTLKPAYQQLADVYCCCTNVECGHTFVMCVSFSHTISPSALKGQGRVKELIDALPEQNRDKALELLLQAKKTGLTAADREERRMPGTADR